MTIEHSFGDFAGQVNPEAVGAGELWERVLEQVFAISRLGEGWDGSGAEAIRPEIIRSTLRLIRRLSAEGFLPPHDAYPLPSGTVVLEWQLASSVIHRIEVEGMGKGQWMVSFPDAPAQFSDLTWHAPEAAYQQVGHVTQRVDTESLGEANVIARSGNTGYNSDADSDSYQMAA